LEREDFKDSKGIQEPKVHKVLLDYKEKEDLKEIKGFKEKEELKVIEVLKATMEAILIL
jgi:hypothetical protein